MPGKRGAPLMRNKQIVDYADKMIAFWDGESRGTSYAINYAGEKGKQVNVIHSEKE